MRHTATDSRRTRTCFPERDHHTTIRLRVQEKTENVTFATLQKPANLYNIIDTNYLGGYPP